MDNNNENMNLEDEVTEEPVEEVKEVRYMNRGRMEPLIIHIGNKLITKSYISYKNK
jgi:hypothetical protein